jgi:hypothetical protein
MPAAQTYEPIATYTVPSNTTSYTFSSIPGTYTDLVIVASVVSSSANTLFIRFNGDTSALYSATRLAGSGSAAFSDRETRGSSYGVLSYYAAPTATAGQHNTILNVMNYSNTTTFKTYINRSNVASAGTDAIVGLYGSTSAITSIGFSTNGFGGTSTLLTGTTLTLYGIKAA